MSYDLNKIYPLQPMNWYKTYPYGFAFQGKDGTTMKMWLPINPNNLNITTHFATTVATTLYGVVEEHSEVRYYDIVISGTTGFVAHHYKPENMETSNFARGIKSVGTMINEGFGRQAFVYTPDLNLQGFAQKAVGVWNQTTDAIKNIQKGIKNTTGVEPLQTGYTAFHNLYRFLMTYKSQVGGDRGISTNKKHIIHGLMFLNYKDGTKYECVPRTFTLTRSVESPMMYNYQIVLRAYNLRGINEKPPMEQEKLQGLGLDGISGSIFSSMKNLISSAKTVVGGALSLLPR
jgi:hypothetical protein